MLINDFFGSAQSMRSQKVPNAAVELVHEHQMTVYINSIPAASLTCTPEHLDELVVGRLLTEGIIASAEDIISICIDARGLSAMVFIRAERKETPAAPDARIPPQKGGLPVLQPIKWQTTQIRRLFSCIRDNAPLYDRTHAVHSCFLGCGDTVLCGREDIGRHNAVDKTVGWACLAGQDLQECILFTTGRMPLDMVQKAIRARIPVLASKTYPTAEAAELAEQHGLTLLTLPPRGELIVWNDPALNRTQRKSS